VLQQLVDRPHGVAKFKAHRLSERCESSAGLVGQTLPPQGSSNGMRQTVDRDL